MLHLHFISVSDELGGCLSPGSTESSDETVKQKHNYLNHHIHSQSGVENFYEPFHEFVAVD